MVLLASSYDQSRFFRAEDLDEIESQAQDQDRN